MIKKKIGREIFEKIPKKIWLVSPNNKTDFIAVNLKTAREMSDPGDGSGKFPIQEWVLKDGKYLFHKDLK